MDEAQEAKDDLVNPRQLALTYDRVISAHWRGETDDVTAFGTWFESHWSDQAPPEPDDPPEGTSILGGAGSGIRWYARDDVVLGYVSRRPSGCYRVQVSEAIPSVIASQNPAARRADADHLLHQSGAGPFVASANSDEREPAASQWRRQDAAPGERDLPASVATNATTRHAAAGDRLAADESADTEVLVATHVLEKSADGKRSCVPAGR